LRRARGLATPALRGASITPSAYVRASTAGTAPHPLASRSAGASLVVPWALVAWLEVVGARVEVRRPAGIALGAAPASTTRLAASPLVRSLVDSGSSASTLGVSSPACRYWDAGARRLLLLRLTLLRLQWLACRRLL
jgi:hypothetical protein